jgi:hypothetical protein
MRSGIIQEMLDKITDEEREQFQKETEAFLKREEELREKGHKYGTNTSYSLVELNEANHFPIGITTLGCEESFIFSSERKANKAWKSRTLGYDGYFYSLEDFRKEKQWYENKMNVKLKVYWLWK